MADRPEIEALLARLNEASDILGALRAGGLGALLKGGNVAGCDYHCNCNDSFCRCNGGVKSQVFDTISYPEFLAMREARLEELRREIQALEPPKDLGGSASAKLSRRY